MTEQRHPNAIVSSDILNFSLKQDKANDEIAKTDNRLNKSHNQLSIIIDYIWLEARCYPSPLTPTTMPMMMITVIKKMTRPIQNQLFILPLSMLEQQLAVFMHSSQLMLER